MLVVIALGRLFVSEVLRFVAYIYERENTLIQVALFFCLAISIRVGVIYSYQTKTSVKISLSIYVRLCS